MGPLCVGGATVVLPPQIDSAFSIEAVADAVIAHRATWAFVVPAVARLLLDHLSRADTPRLTSLRSLYIGGEFVPLSLARDMQSALPTCRIVQAYGPAECTVFTTCYRLAPGDVAFPLGVPLPGYRIVLLDDKDCEASRGQVGTMHVVGNALFTAYLGLESTALREISLASERVVAYNTGDLARLDAAGALHFMGRRDRQVKLHGQRLELAGIEAAASACGIVRAVAVKKWSVPPDRQFLAAYVAWQKEALARSNAAALEKQLRDELSRKLPGWMVPAVFVSAIGDLPRNAHKKVDYNALQLPRSNAADAKKAMRVCVIGGGVAGLLVAIDAIRRGIQVKIIERSYAVGGVWVNGAASVYAYLQQPGEYYAVDGPLPTRFPSGGVVAGYLADVASRHRLDSAVLSAEVTDVAPSPDSEGLCVTWRQRAEYVTETFDFVICATGRFSPSKLVRPEWVPSGVLLDAHYTELPRFVAASRLQPEKCARKRIAIVGGGHTLWRLCGIASRARQHS